METNHVNPFEAQTSFTARRPTACGLSSFGLPPPPVSAVDEKYPAAVPTITATMEWTSAGALLTPPASVKASWSPAPPVVESEASLVTFSPFPILDGGMLPRLSMPSPANSAGRVRSSSHTSDQRDYILNLAKPERTPSNGVKDNGRVPKHPATFQCHLCAKRFTRAYNLRSHLRTHPDEPPFVCAVCGQAFSRQYDRRRHEEGLHSGEKKFDSEYAVNDDKAGAVDAESIKLADTAATFLPPALLAQYPALADIDWNVRPDEGYHSGSHSLDTSANSECDFGRADDLSPPHIRSSIAVGMLSMPQSEMPVLPGNGALLDQFMHAKPQINHSLPSQITRTNANIGIHHDRATHEDPPTPRHDIVEEAAPFLPQSVAPFNRTAPTPAIGLNSINDCSGGTVVAKSSEQSKAGSNVEWTKESHENQSARVDEADALPSETPVVDTRSSTSPFSSTEGDEDGSESPSQSSSEQTDLSIDSPDQPPTQTIESAAGVTGTLHRLERILEHLETLADDLSYSSSPGKSDSDDESHASTSFSTDASFGLNGFGIGSTDLTSDNYSNELSDNADNSNNSGETSSTGGEVRGNPQSTGSGQVIGQKRSLDSNGEDHGDEADDGSNKREKKSPDSSSFDLDQPVSDLRDQIPCFVDGCCGRDAHISEMIRKCAKHHSFFVCTRCYLQIQDKATFDHHRTTGDGCEPHCISSSCCLETLQTDTVSLLGTRHKRRLDCPPDKKVSVQDRWQYLHHLHYPERSSLSLVLQPSLPHPHGTGRPKSQRKQSTKPLPSDQFRQQLSEARNEIQNLRTQQALDTAMLEITAKEHSDKVLRLEMVIAACVELIPRVPGSIQRMLEVDAPGALKMVEKAAGVLGDPRIQVQQSALFLTPQQPSRMSQGSSSSPGSARTGWNGDGGVCKDFFTSGGAVDLDGVLQ